MVISANVLALFESPCVLVVGGHDNHGAPAAAWAWGPAISDDGATLRLIVESELTFAVGRMLAITAGDLVTARSLQVKGTIAASEAPSPDDRYRMQRHIDGFRGALEDHDGVARDRTDGVWATDRNSYRSYVVRIEAAFEQSAGPNAGAALAGS